MLQLISLMVIGFLVGIFVISLGGGGGAIYLGVLSGLFQLAPRAAAATSIVTALPALVIGAWSYYRKRLIDFKLGNRMLLAAIPSIIIGFLISPLIPKQIYKIVIGLILIVLGLQIIYQLYRNAPQQKRRVAPGMASILYGIIGGLMVGIAGLSGGGPITAGLLILGVSMKRASATSSYTLIGMSIVGALLHLTGGNVDWQAAGGLIVGSLLGAFLAPSVIIWLTNKPSRTFMVKLFMGIFIAVMGCMSMK